MNTKYSPNKTHLLRPEQWLRSACLLACALLVTACATSQNHSSAQHLSIDLNAIALENQGLAFISPSTVTGREEDKQALAFIVSGVLKRERPDIRQISLPQALGAINKAGLASAYKSMFEDYQTTGIFNQTTLKQIGQAVNARYVLQLNLASFDQGSRGRFSMLGYRLFETKHANIRMFIQIWDTETGTIAWEGVEELIMAEDTSSERVINFTTVVEASASNLIHLLPRHNGDTKQLTQMSPSN